MHTIHITVPRAPRRSLVEPETGVASAHGVSGSWRSSRPASQSHHTCHHCHGAHWSDRVRSGPPAEHRLTNCPVVRPASRRKATASASRSSVAQALGAAVVRIAVSGPSRLLPSDSRCSGASLVPRRSRWRLLPLVTVLRGRYASAAQLEVQGSAITPAWLGQRSRRVPPMPYPSGV